MEEVIERLERDAKKPLACKKITLCNVDDLTRIIKYIKEESISKAVVEEKIKELIKNEKFITTDFIRIDILQELLKKGE